MRVQRSRADVLPLTWEVPTAITACWLLASFLALPAGQGIALWLTGEGFVWPRGTLVENVMGLVHGDVGRGLPAEDIASLPSDALIYSAVTSYEVLVCVVATCAFIVWWHSIGPGAQFGIAGRHDVERVLGTGNLRRRRTTIRPDLHPQSRGRLRS